MNSAHLFKFSQKKADEKAIGGMRIRADKANFPILKGMSLYKLILVPNGVREPHWHANADELGYCLKGSALISLYDTKDAKATFLVEEGDLFLIPSGALHAIENVSDKVSEFILNFNHESVEDFSISSMLGVFSDAVLGNTWGVKSEVFHSLERSLTPTFATLTKNHAPVSEDSCYTSPYRYSLKKAEPILESAAGSVKMARQNFWPILKNQALYSLLLTNQGMREPHWHPETAELGYVQSGKGRMSVLSPDGTVDTYIMEEGDVYFIPKAYPHHIENLGEKLELLICFDQPMPKDIGLTGSMLSYSDEVLASVLKTNPAFFDPLHKYYADLFIVNRINPLDFS